MIKEIRISDDTGESRVEAMDRASQIFEAWTARGWEPTVAVVVVGDVDVIQISADTLVFD